MVNMLVFNNFKKLFDWQNPLLGIASNRFLFTTPNSVDS